MLLARTSTLLRSSISALPDMRGPLALVLVLVILQHTDNGIIGITPPHCLTLAQIAKDCILHRRVYAER